MGRRLIYKSILSIYGYCRRTYLMVIDTKQLHNPVSKYLCEFIHVYDGDHQKYKVSWEHFLALWIYLLYAKLKYFEIVDC